MPASPQRSGSSPKRAAYARMDASTARACLRRLSPLVNSVRIDQATSRVMSPLRGFGSAGSATCRWISWRRPSRPRAASTESAARWRGRPARSCRWPGTATPRRCSARPSGSDSRALLLVDRLAQRLDVCFEHPNPLHQLLERFRDRIREIRLIQVDVADALAVLVCYSAGNADDNAVRRNFADNDGAGADPAVVADRERAEHLGAGADDDVVAEGRVTLLLPEARSAQRHPLQERDVLADFGRLADDDAHPVI